jgi:hypothetical protein
MATFTGVRLSEVRRSEVRLSEVRRFEVRLSEVRHSELRLSEVRRSEVRISEVKPSVGRHCSFHTHSRTSRAPCQQVVLLVLEHIHTQYIKQE